MKTKLRLGIIGAGSVVREIYQHLYFRSHYSHLFDICAVADPNEQYRNWFADLAGVPASRRFPITATSSPRSNSTLFRSTPPITSTAPRPWTRSRPAWMSSSPSPPLPPSRTPTR